MVKHSAQSAAAAFSKGANSGRGTAQGSVANGGGATDESSIKYVQKYGEGEKHAPTTNSK